MSSLSRHHDAQAAEQLLPLVYEEQRKLAAAKLAHESPGLSLEATALVHEAYLRLAAQGTPQQWDNRRHFLAAAAEAMRRILIERARQRISLKRGGEYSRVDLDGVEPETSALSCEDLLAIDEAVKKLQQRHPRQAELVKLRFFAGLTMTESAEALGVSLATAENDWAYARCWLRLEMGGKSRAADS